MLKRQKVGTLSELFQHVSFARNLCSVNTEEQQAEQVAQLSQRDCTAGCVIYGQTWKTVNGRQYFTDIIGLSSTIVT